MRRCGCSSQASRKFQASPLCLPFAVLPLPPLTTPSPFTPRSVRGPVPGCTPHTCQDIASHKFCLAPVGGGYGKRQMHSIFMGCVPVLIGDGVLQPFEPEIDWGRFSVSVEEGDIPSLPKILAAISKTEYTAMQVR